jgi:ribonuclease HI
MIESYLETGCQPISPDPADLKYGSPSPIPALAGTMTASALAEGYKLLGERCRCSVESADEAAPAPRRQGAKRGFLPKGRIVSAEPLIVYTDGGCSAIPVPAAGDSSSWTDGGNRPIGGDRATTNNRMELTAVIEALRLIEADPAKSGRPVSVHTDSQYVQKGISELDSRVETKRVAHRVEGPGEEPDLWMRLDELAASVHPRWVWLRTRGYSLQRGMRSPHAGGDRSPSIAPRRRRAPQVR